MGTNYYWYEKPKCECCDRECEPLHIGKQSKGWVFALHIYPENNIYSLNDWTEKLKTKGSYIKNEYEEEISFSEFKEILQRSKNAKHRDYSYNKDSYCDYLDYEFT